VFPHLRIILLVATSLAYGAWILGPRIESFILLFCGIWFLLLKLSDHFPDLFQKKIWMWFVLLLSSGLYFGLMNLYRWGWRIPRPSVQDLGISYLYLRVIHVTVDWTQGKLGKPGFLRFLIYTFYFPTMMGGPVERYLSFFEGPFFNLEMPWRPLFDRGMVLRFLGGIFKMWICTGLLALPYAQLWDLMPTLSYSVLLKIYYLRAITFYLMVSGINDILLMLSQFMGIPPAENYDYPYFRKNLAHFWRNWHISLSTILRDYIYEPLGGRERHQFFNYLLPSSFAPCGMSALQPSCSGGCFMALE
jgi:D-alanyl-lipoteichoic acid acyltransferase DltB (MBOAT superfamily)